MEKGEKMDLEELRSRVDRIDSDVLKLLNERMELALRTRKLKNAVSDPAREREIVESIRKRSVGLVNPEFSERIFKEIISESRRLQEKNPVLAAFQGEHGAYGEMASRKFDHSAVPVSCREFSEVFKGVEGGKLDLGVVPVENSLEGAVSEVNDLLLNTSLKIVGEVTVPIHHCLLVAPGTDHRDIKVVYSHPQALGQCRGFISRNKLEARPYYDTAGAAMMLASERPTAAAAIASRLCAELYGLEVLKENIEDHESNSTRFLVLSRESAKAEGNKCSIMFSTAHKAGALFGVLKVFSDHQINLTRIESRPVRDEQRRYAFLLDFIGSASDPKISEALAEVEKEASMYKFLGCYGEAPANGAAKLEKGAEK
jgi:prephenate dehydratase/chorismate mutase/prephenate dehydratase